MYFFKPNIRKRWRQGLGFILGFVTSVGFALGAEQVAPTTAATPAGIVDSRHALTQVAVAQTTAAPVAAPTISNPQAATATSPPAATTTPSQNASVSSEGSTGASISTSTGTSISTAVDAVPLSQAVAAPQPVAVDDRPIVNLSLIHI